MSAAISIAGQKTVWNLRMSLPMMWNVAGQKRSVRSSPSRRVAQRGVVVQERVEPDVEDVPSSHGTGMPQRSFARVSETS